VVLSLLCPAQDVEGDVQDEGGDVARGDASRGTFGKLIESNLKIVSLAPN